MVDFYGYGAKVRRSMLEINARTKVSLKDLAGWYDRLVSPAFQCTERRALNTIMRGAARSLNTEETFDASMWKVTKTADNGNITEGVQDNFLEGVEEKAEDPNPKRQLA